MEVAAVWLLALISCLGPGETGRRGIVGRLVDGQGAPIAGVVVQSIEAEARTDADGAFVVAWKPPDTTVTFAVGDIHWARTLVDGDHGTVTVQIPAPGTAPLGCGSVEGPITLRWDAGPGLEGRWAGKCAHERWLKPAGMPEALPRVTRGAIGGAEEALVWVTSDAGPRMALPPRPIRVELRPTEGTLPEDCAVMVGGAAASADGEGFWVGAASDPAWVEAICEGRPARPVQVAAGEGSVAVDWSRAGPDLDLEGAAAWAKDLRLDAAEDDGARWSLRVEVDTDGRFRLPPLPAGRYRVGLPWSKGAVMGAPEVARPDVLVLRGDERTGLVGAMSLSGDRTGGRIAVSGP